MANLPVLRFRALDSSGDPISGAKLNFYEAGTSTRLDTYNDDALTTAHANPVVADGNGWFDMIFGSDDAYKVVLTDASGVEIWTEDNFYFNNQASSSLTTRISQIASNPLDQGLGAIGDGVADESASVQAAIDNATKVVDLLGKTFRCDSAITLASGIILQNGTLDFTNCPDDDYLVIQGTIGAGVALSGNCSVGSVSFSTASTTGIAVEDYIFVSSAGFFVGSSGNTVGHLARVISVTTDTSIGFYPEAPATYNTAETAIYREVTQVSDVVLQNLTINCNEAASGVGNAILIDKAKNVTVRDCIINDVKASAIDVVMSADVFIKNIDVTDANDAVSIEDGSLFVTVEDVRTRGTDLDAIEIGTSKTSGGICQYITIKDCYFDLTVANGVDIDATATHVDIVGCVFQNSVNSITASIGGSCRSINVERCKFFNQTGPSVRLEAAALNYDVKLLRIFGNVFDSSSATNIIIHGTLSGTGVISRLSISNNYLTVGSNGESISLSGNLVDAIDVSHNTFEGGGNSGTHEIIITDSTSTATNQVSVVGNVLNDCASLILATSLKNLVIANNSVDTTDGSTAESIIDIDNSSIEAQTILITGNNLRSNRTAMIDVNCTHTTDSGMVTIANNNIDASQASSGGGVIVEGQIRQLSATGNNWYGPAAATGSCFDVAFTVYEMCNISNNTFNHGTAAGLAIKVDDNSAGEGHVTISGNTQNLGIGLLECTDAKDIAVTGNNVYTTSSAGNALLLVSNTTEEFRNVSICGNNLYSDKRAIQVSGSYASTQSENVVVSGNNIRGTVTNGGVVRIDGYIEQVTVTGNNVENTHTTAASAAGCVRVLAAAANTIVAATTTGNCLKGGEFGIITSSVTEHAHSANIFRGQGTGDTSGTFTAVVNS